MRRRRRGSNEETYMEKRKKGIRIPYPQPKRCAAGAEVPVRIGYAVPLDQSFAMKG
jgi:hypothetical protein